MEEIKIRKGTEADLPQVLGLVKELAVYERAPNEVEVTLQDVKVCRNGLAAPFDEMDMKQRLDDTDVSIVFRIAGKGKGNATFWTCDLTEDYIHINANYRT